MLVGSNTLAVAHCVVTFVNTDWLWQFQAVGRTLYNDTGTPGVVFEILVGLHCLEDFDIIGDQLKHLHGFGFRRSYLEYSIGTLTLPI